MIDDPSTGFDTDTYIRQKIAQAPEDRKPYTSLHFGMSGWKAVIFWYNNEEPPRGFWEPLHPGNQRFPDAHKDLAIVEAKRLATKYGIEYRG